MGYGDVVRAQTYLTNMADFPKFSGGCATVISRRRNPPAPCSSVKGLAHEDAASRLKSLR